MSLTPQRSSPAVLDLPSEAILASEQEGFPQTDYAGFSFSGRCDAAALNHAFLQAQAGRPNLHAHLKRTRMGLLVVLAWHVCDELNQLQVRDCSTMAQVPDDLEAWVHQQMAGEIDHCLGLSREFPAKFILFLLPEDRCVVVLVFHHVVTDAGGVYNFMRDVFRHYHSAVTGADPDWAATAGMHAQAGEVRPVVAVSIRRFLADAVSEFRRYPFFKVAQIESHPRGQTGRKMIRHIIDSQDLQRALRERARREGGTLSDLVMAASKLALDEFNSSRGTPPDVLYHCMAVNQRLRRPPSELAGQGNPVSVIGIPSNREDRKDPQALLRYVVACRKRKLAQGRDVVLGRVARDIMLASRVVPLSLRHRFLRAVAETKISFYVTNLGVVWPRIENGRPTGETIIRSVGGMDLLDIHTSVGTGKKNANAMFLRTFLDRLYLVFFVGRHKVEDRDADEFSALVVRKLLGYL